MTQKPKPKKQSVATLRLVDGAGPSSADTGLTHPANRRAVRQLTQELVDAMVEINDLLDPDPDLEPETEDDDSGI